MFIYFCLVCFFVNVFLVSVVVCLCVYKANFCFKSNKIHCINPFREYWSDIASSWCPDKVCNSMAFHISQMSCPLLVIFSCFINVFYDYLAAQTLLYHFWFDVDVVCCQCLFFYLLLLIKLLRTNYNKTLKGKQFDLIWLNFIDSKLPNYMTYY